MGKLVISSCGKQQQQQRSPSSSLAAAAGYVTRRSGRRVPAAATTCSPRSMSQCRRSSGRRCGAKSARGSPRRKSAAGAKQRCRVVDSSPLLVSGDRPEQEEAPAPVKASTTGFRDDGSGDGRQDTLLSVEASRQHQGEADSVADRPTRRRSPPEADMEAFFAAVELAERRRFTEKYNYDVALDRPLEGRFEWAPVSA